MFCRGLARPLCLLFEHLSNVCNQMLTAAQASWGSAEHKLDVAAMKLESSAVVWKVPALQYFSVTHRIAVPHSQLTRAGITATATVCENVVHDVTRAGGTSRQLFPILSLSQVRADDVVYSVALTSSMRYVAPDGRAQ